jgi:hypothetical protein
MWGTEGSQPQPYPYDEWVRIAGWTEQQRVFKTDGTGFEESEILWQMGKDPYEERRDQEEAARRTREFFEQGERERAERVAAEHRAAAERLERERLAADVNRALMPGLAPPTREARLKMLLAELRGMDAGDRGTR